MNILLALLGFLAWVIGAFTIEKDSYDDLEKDFPYRTYIKKNWDNWVWNLIIAFILIVVGIYKLEFDALPFESESVQKIQWHDSYYLASGPIGSIAMKYIKKIKKASKQDV